MSAAQAKVLVAMARAAHRLEASLPDTDAPPPEVVVHVTQVIAIEGWSNVQRATCRSCMCIH